MRSIFVDIFLPVVIFAKPQVDYQNPNYGGSRQGYGVQDQNRYGVGVTQHGNNPYAQNPGFLNPLNPGPVVNRNGSTYTNGTVPLQNGGVNVQVKLLSYADPGNRLPYNRVCVCPNDKCISASPQHMGYNCYFSFMVIISSADSSVRYFSTPFVMLDQNGNIDQNGLTNFQQIFNFNLVNQPTAIDIFVYHLGAVIDAATGDIVNLNDLTQVDTFVQLLDENSMSSGSSNSHQNSLSGQMLGTQLRLSYSVSCQGSLIGPGCDLACNKSSVNTNKAVCQNQKTGYFSVCQWTTNNQVNQCQNCPWGIKDNAYCMDEDGGVLEMHHAGVVSDSFRTWTIVLAIACGALIILLLLVIVLGVVRARKNPEADYRDSAPGYNSNRTDYGQSRGAPESTPLYAGNGGDRPIPSPRHNPPSLNSSTGSQKPIIKSALKNPGFQLPPPAHLGGGADSLNSSYTDSSRVPVPPSRSADV